MKTYTRYRQLFWIIVLTALPAVAATVLYLITENPTLRPLGITAEQVALFEGEVSDVSIEVTLDWGRDQQEGASLQAMRKRIADALLLQTDSFIIKTNEVPGESVGVSFRVGPNFYGPFPPTRMAEGMVPALIALNMTQKARQ